MVTVRVLEVEDEERAFMLFEDDGGEFGVYSGPTESIVQIADLVKVPVIWLRSRGDESCGMRRWFSVGGEDYKETLLADTDKLYKRARGVEGC